MTAPTLAPAPPSPKGNHASTNKGAINRNSSPKESSFENELNEATPPTESKETVSLEEIELISESDLETAVDSCSTQTNSEPIQTLFPAQMAIQIVEPPKEETSSDKNSDGLIFPNEENKSPSITQLISTSLAPTAKQGQEINSTPESHPSLSQDLQNTAILSSEINNKQNLESPPPTHLKVLELLASVNEAASSEDKKIPLDLSSFNLNPTESLKSATTQAKPESITLSSQHRLETVLDSVFEETPLPTPRRIEVKLQTPQGSQITLYIARVNQELRAQFSANNQQALAWLQSEIGQLRTLNSSEAIRWLPAQMEVAIPKTENSGKSSNKKSEDDPEQQTPLDSIFDLFKPSTRRLA